MVSGDYSGSEFRWTQQKTELTHGGIIDLFYAGIKWVVLQAEGIVSRIEQVVKAEFAKRTQPIATLPLILRNKYDPSGYPWFEKIIENKLTLGAIPLKNFGHLDDLCNRGITAVVSVIKDYEFSDGVYSVPVKPEDLEAKNIAHLVLRTVDGMPLSIEDMIAGVEFINEIIEKGGHVLVHCKADVARSASLVTAYLLACGKKHGLYFDSVDGAIKHVTSKRNAVAIGGVQKEAIKLYWDVFKRARSALDALYRTFRE